MTEIISVEMQNDFTQNFSREAVADLMARVDVISRRLSEARPARWVGAAVDVLCSLPQVPYTVVASLWVPGSSTFATALVYERCPHSVPLDGQPVAHSPGVQLLLKRARELGADAVVLHSVSTGERRLEAA